MQARILTFICNHSHIDRDVLESLMMKPDEMSNDIGSVLEGAEAVRLGMIDEVGGLESALTALKGMMEA